MAIDSALVNKYLSYRKDLNFIKKYCNAQNAASGSEVDANSNVSNKNIATMAPEIHKKDNIYANRLMMHDYLTKMYDRETADEYIRQLEEHEIYRHDESGMPVGTPYTYSGKEAIVVYQHGETLLTSLESLYDHCDSPEVLVDEEKMVFQKYPSDLYVADRNGCVKITALTKKKRHVDLVCVKTQFGENVIVTSNHPMIISDDINHTVDAKDALGKQQYRIAPGEVMTGDWTAKQALSVPTGEKYRYYTVCKSGNYSYVSRPNFLMDSNLGYFIGFFIAEGWYRTDARNGHTSMMIKVKGDRDLHACADALFLSTGIAATVSGYEDERGFKTLTVSHPDFVRFCMETLDLGTKAPEKKLPKTIFQYSDDFKRGVICGLVDGDGTEHNGRFLIRLASRTCISQLASVLHHLNVPVSMSYTDNSEKEDGLIQSCYPTFSIEFPQDQFTASRKFNSEKQQKYSKYQPSGWVDVTNVIPVTNKYYLRDSNYIYDITTESHTFVMNNLWVHNCASITLYPFLFDGMKKLGGTTEAPKHLQSFLGGYINLVFAVSAQLCGAVATPEFLSYMDYFIRKEYGDDYYLHPDKVVDLSSQNRTIDKIITDGFAQVVYSLNQPAAARGSQSVFLNFAYFDKPYFEQLFDGFVFPDGTEMQWESVSWLQKRFMKWFNRERKKNILTFPVETLSLLNDGHDFVDKEWADFAAEMYAEGHSFFTYTSDSVDSLASCCRLRNGIQDNQFSYTLGAGGVSTGSKCVMTMDLNRLVQNAVRSIDIDEVTLIPYDVKLAAIRDAVANQVEKIHKYLLAFNQIVLDMRDNHMLSIYDAGFIAPEKQYLTVGVNGLVEGAEFLGLQISDNPEYAEYVNAVMEPIFESNKAAKTKTIMFNTEMVPAENLGVKFAKWDREDGYEVPRDCYNSYFYVVEDEKTNPVDKFRMHGKTFTGKLDGGSALHCNLDEHLTKPQYERLLKYAISTGCNYFTFNIPNTICNDCGYISKHRLDKCPKCGSENLDYATRVN